MGKKDKKLSNREKREEVKKRLRYYYNDLNEIEIIKRVIKNLRDNMSDLKSASSDVESVQGGTSKQEDVLISDIDKIKKLEDKIKDIEYKHIDLINALDVIKKDDEAFDIIKHVWLYRDKSMADMGKKLCMSKDKVWSISDSSLSKMHYFMDRFNRYQRFVNIVAMK